MTGKKLGMTDNKTALVTGSAGFVGFHLCRRLLADGFRVIGLDAMTEYYDVTLKTRRNQILLQSPGYSFRQQRVEEPGGISELLAAERPHIVVHLAAQAGVRYSIEAPRSYLESNIDGTFEVLEAARAVPSQHLLIASTSSVYGANADMPYGEDDRTATQMSFYAATKRATEAMAHSYAHLYGMPTTMFRFFTVYGPWGRPDMALFKFTRAILTGEPIDVYNHGDMRRDFTYIDDLVESIRRLIDLPPEPPSGAPPQRGGSPVAPYRIVNIGNAKPVELTRLIAAVETAIGKPASRNMMEMQPGDMQATWADNQLLKDLTDFVPRTRLEDGVAEFVAWYRDYYGV
mgnify:CR=1 FL=1